MYRLRCLYRHFLTFYFAAIAVVGVGLAIIGAVRHYSPVPFWDVWTGYVNFNSLVNNGEYQAWWAQHNEHRIVLSKLLFWLDVHCFGGDQKMLLVVNFLLIVTTIILFWRIARNIEVNKNAQLPWWLKCFAILWLFSWVQSENLAWGFQSQFFLAQLLPLIGFYCLHLSQTKHARYFILGLSFGILSIGSMANGIMALPLMTAFAILARFSWQKILLLLAASIFGISIYFYNYSSPTGEGVFVKTLIEQPVAVIQYVLLYIGGPFYRFLGKGTAAQIFSSAFAVGLIVCSASLFFKNIKHFKTKTLTLALLMFIIYIGGTALGSAGGRVMYGIEQAASSRYTTPTLMLWVAFFLLMWSELECRKCVHALIFKVVIFVLSLCVISLQFEARYTLNRINQQKYLAALAVTLGADDAEVIHRIHWNSKELLNLVKAAKSQQIAIFGVQPFRSVLNNRGKTLSVANQQACQGHIEPAQALDKNFMKITGWAVHHQQQVSGVGYVLNADGLTSGAVLLGYQRPKVAKQMKLNASYNGGFHGYIDRHLVGQQAVIFFPSMNCVLQQLIETEVINNEKSHQ